MYCTLCTIMCQCKYKYINIMYYTFVKTNQKNNNLLFSNVEPVFIS